MTRKVSNYQYDIGVKRSRSHLVKICNMFMACYANSFFVLSTNIDSVVYIIKNDTDQRYDRGHRLIRICLTVVCF